MSPYRKRFVQFNMLFTLLLCFLVLLVQVFQSLGTWLSKKCDKRLKK